MALFTLILCVLFLYTSLAQSVSNELEKDSIQSEKNDVLAFSAELSGHAEVAPGGTIVFDRTITNVGGLYFNTSGQFVCPDGLYVFIWNLMKMSASEAPGMRCIGLLRYGGVDGKYGPKTSYFNTGFSGAAEMTSIHACSNTTPSAVTITAQPWTEGINSNSLFHQEITSFSGFKVQAGIAFTAELSTDQLAFPGARIMFDDVLANVGGYYDGINGRFRCPDDGLYVFTVSSHTRTTDTPWSASRLVMEGKVVMQGPITYIATDDYDSGSSSTTTVLQCTPDFSVYVEAQATYDFPHNSYGAKLTSFTGFKLYAINAESVAFTVLMTQNFTKSTNEPVPFDEVITNIGGAFNASASSFVCPDDMYYLFTWTAVAVSIPSNANIYLNMDGSRVKRMYTTPVSGSAIHTSGSCTQSVILQCQTGSVFQVILATSNRTILGGYTSFSGYKLPG